MADIPPAKLYGWDDYNDHFDPKVYLEKYQTEKNLNEDNVYKFMNETFSRIFNDVLKKKVCPEARLLEIGTGPNLFMSLFANNVFNEIYLSDYSEANRTALKKSLNGDADAFNWQAVVKRMRQHKVKIEENTMQQLRKKVKDILVCNVKDPKVLQKPIGTIDVLACLLCLEAASDTMAEYQEASKNIINLLKPGGYYVQSGVLDQPYYDGGSAFFRSLSTTKKEVLDTLDINGIDVQEYFEYYHGGQGGPWKDGSPANVGFYACYGIKRSK